MRWIPVTERLPEGADAISCEAWCEAEEPGDVAGPCIMSFDADAKPGDYDPWTPREDTGCWEPGPVSHWRPRPTGPNDAQAHPMPLGCERDGGAAKDCPSYPRCGCSDGMPPPQPPGCEYPKCECPIVGLNPQCGKHTGNYKPSDAVALAEGGMR